jgi:hypothetical protein
MLEKLLNVQFAPTLSLDIRTDIGRYGMRNFLRIGQKNLSD